MKEFKKNIEWQKGAEITLGYNVTILRHKMTKDTQSLMIILEPRSQNKIEALQG